MAPIEGYQISNEKDRQHKLECSGRKAIMIKGVVVILEATTVKATRDLLRDSGAQ